MMVSLIVQLRVLWSNPKLLAGGVLVAIFAQTLYKKRKRAWEGRAPIVSYFLPWVGSGLEIRRDPDGFFSRAQ